MIEYIQSPPIGGKEGYNCFVVQYRAHKATFQLYTDSYRFQLIVNGEIYVNRRLDSVSVSRVWHMDVMDIPDFGESENVVQVRFELCAKCRARFKSFIFTERHCRTPTGELNGKVENQMERILNEFRLLFFDAKTSTSVR